MKNQLNKNQITLATVLFAVVLSGALYAFFFSAVEKKIESAYDIFAQAEELENEQNKQVALLSLLRTYSSDIGRVEERFIKEGNIVLLTKQLEEIGMQAGVVSSLESLEPSTGAEKEPVLNVRIKATGDFAKVIYFAELLENFPVVELELSAMRLVRINDEANVAKGVKATLPQWEFSVFATVLNFVKE